MIKSKIKKKIITIAPEVLGKKLIKKFTKKNIYLLAGHTNASGEEIKQYFKKDILGVTHLFNACSQMTARDIGVVGASLLNPNTFNTIIADGVHISDDMLKIAFKIKEAKKFALISDSMELIGTNKKSFKIYNQTISLKKNSLLNDSGTLAGAHLTMLSAFQYILRKKLVTLLEAIGMTSTNQTEFLGLEHKGAILPHYDANMLLINKNSYELMKVIFFGKVVK